MGYHTDFEGSFQLSKPATEQQIAYLNRFSYTRRVKRDVTILKETQGGAYGLNDEYGVEGEFFVGECEKSIIDINRPPSTQPGLWCDCECRSWSWCNTRRCISLCGCFSL